MSKRLAFRSQSLALARTVHGDDDDAGNPAAIMGGLISFSLEEDCAKYLRRPNRVPVFPMGFLSGEDFIRFRRIICLFFFSFMCKCGLG